MHVMGHEGLLNAYFCNAFDKSHEFIKCVLCDAFDES